MPSYFCQWYLLLPRVSRIYAFSHIIGEMVSCRWYQKDWWRSARGQRLMEGTAISSVTPLAWLIRYPGLARIFHESPAANTDMAVLPGVLGCSFDKLRTGSPCDVPFRYVSASILDFGFRISDFSLQLMISNLTVQISPFVLRFSQTFKQIFNPHSAIRIRRLGGTPIFLVSRQ